MQRGVLPKLLGIRLLDESVGLLAIKILIDSFWLLVLIHIRSTSILLNKQSDNILIAVTGSPKNW